MRPGTVAARCDSQTAQSCGAVMRLRCDRRGHACGDGVLQSLPEWDLLGDAGQKYDDSKWECFATMISSFAMGELNGVLWEEGKDEQERRGDGQLRCGCAGADAKRGKTTRPFQSLPKRGWAGAGGRLEGGWPGSLLSCSPGHARSLSPRWAIMALATTARRVTSSTPSTDETTTADD